MNGITINRAVVRSRCWTLIFAVLAFGITVGLPQAVSMAQYNPEPPGIADDNLNFRGEGKTPQTIRQAESFLNWMIRSSGIFGFLIMLVSFTMVAIIMMIAIQLRRDNYLPSSFIEEFEQQIQAKDYEGAYQSAKSSDSFIGRVLTAGMGRLSRGYDEAVEQMQQIGDEESMAMEHKIGYLSLIGSIAPMLGLLGTVQGMVLSFQVIASSTTSPKPAELADGVATALFTTLEGLVVAIPAIIFYSLYKNRLARFLMESGFVAENLMKNFQGMPKQSSTSTRVGNTTQAIAS